MLAFCLLQLTLADKIKVLTDQCGQHYSFLQVLVIKRFIFLIVLLLHRQWLLHEIIANYCMKHLTWVTLLTYVKLHGLLRPVPCLLLTLKLVQHWKSANFFVFTWNYMSKISHQNTFYVLRYAHVGYLKSLFTYIQKQ